MGLFSKKQCSICGQEIGLLGNRACKDGNLCKACAGKLSPWFRSRKKTTIADIKKQLEYRKANEAKVKTFNVSRSYGNNYRILVDDAQGGFLVTNRDDWRKTNPDVVPLIKLTSCDVTVTEYKNEKRNSEGESFDPKQYTYEYAFNVKLIVDTPYFDSISFDLTSLSDRPTSKDSDEYGVLMDTVNKMKTEFKGGELRMKTAAGSASIDEDEDLEDDEWRCVCGTVNDSNYCSSCGKPKPEGVKWFCPNCGTENYGNFCKNCGKGKPE